MSADDFLSELETARRVFDQDPRHAIHHLAGAFALAPNDERAHALYDAFAQRLDVLTNLPDEDGFSGTYLLKAFALQRRGNIDAAVALLAQVTEALPDRGYELLLTAWLVALKARGGVLGRDAASQGLRLLTSVVGSTIGLNRLMPGEQALLSGFGELALALLELCPDPSSRILAAGVLRRVGRYDEVLAIPVPDSGKERAPGLTQRGLVLRAAGRAAEAAPLFAEVARLSPGDRTYIIEQARCWFVAGDFDRANALLAEVTGESNPEVQDLTRLCGERPGGDRLELLDGIRRAQAAPTLEPPGDATANIFRDARDKLTPGQAAVSVHVSGWESPSNRLLVALFQSGTPDVAAASYGLTKSTLAFDPLSTRRGAGPALWHEVDGVVRQAAPAPLAELRNAIGRVSVEAKDFATLWQRAAELGGRLDATVAPDIAAAMVHPPGDAAWLAELPGVLMRYQVAAACVLANLPQAWAKTKPVFEALLFGPVDWTSAAAIDALAELARRDAKNAVEIRSLLISVAGDLLNHSCEPRFWPLVTALGTLPGVPHEARKKLTAWRERNMPERDKTPESGDPTEQSPAPDAARPETVEPKSKQAAKRAGGAPIAVLVVLGALVLYALLRAMT